MRPSAERRAQDCGCLAGIDAELRRQRRRRAHQLLLRPRVAHQMHEAVDGLGRRGEAADALLREQLARLPARLLAEPRRDDRLGQGRGGLVLVHDRRDPLRDLGAGGQRRRAVHDQDRVGLVARQQHLQRLAVSGRIGIADDVDRIAARPGRWAGRRRARVSCRSESWASVPPRSPSRSAASTPAPPPLVRIASRSPPSLGWRASISAALKRSPSLSHAQQAGAPEGGLVGGVRAGKRAGVRQRGLGAAGAPAGLDDDDGLGSRRAPGRRHELRRVGDRFHVEQDGAAVDVAGQVVEQIAEVDVGHVAERDHVREADAAPARPVDDGRDQRAGLGQEGEVARQGRAMGEAGVEADARQHETQAVGALHAQEVGRDASSIACLRSLRTPAVMTTAARVPFAPSSPISCGTVCGGVTITARSGAAGRASTEAWQSWPSMLLCFGLTSQIGAGEAAAQHVARGDQADAAGPRARADDRDRAGVQQIFKMADRHVA